ncbi:MAG TPA: OsmC family protein [Thermoanaerobaculia bacterium]|nr:OsmC family protein [Thermoanaerobaculia bacterium]
MGPVIVRAGASLRNEIEAGQHRLIADEPASAGGTDAGPTPYDFLSAGLGGCTSMTMRVVAKRENIPLEGVEVHVTNDRMYAKDCADCSSNTGYIHRFDVRIKLIGNLTEQQRERLLSVARRCPVAKTLTSEIRIEESLL